MSETRRDTAIKILLGLLGCTLGFGFSQLTVAGDVRVHTTELRRIDEAFKEERARTDQRIFEAVGLIKQQVEMNRAMVDQNRELITMMRVHLSTQTTGGTK